MVSTTLYSQTQNSVEKKYYSKIKYQDIPNRALFEILSPREIEHSQKKSSEKTNQSIKKLPDSITAKYSLDEIKLKYAPYEYKNNRSRIFYNVYYNKKKQNKKNYLKKGMDLPCGCQMKNDTLTVVTGFGFFGGLGFASKINRKKFTNYFWEYSDHEYLKLKKEDSILKKSIEIGSKYQKMILEKKPKIGQVLTGYFSIYTKPYYTNNTKSNVHGEVYFKCFVFKKQTTD